MAIDYTKLSDKFLNKWLILVLDLFIVCFAFTLASIIRFNFKFEYINPDIFKYHLGFVILVNTLFFYIFQTYAGIIRHSGTEEALSLLKASTAATVTSVTIQLIELPPSLSYIQIPLSISLISYFIRTSMLISSRFVIKSLYDRLINSFKKEKKVVIYGAGHLGRITRSTLLKDKNINHNILFYIDDNTQLVGKSLNNIPILSFQQAMNKLEGREQEIELIFAIQSISPIIKNEILDELLKKGFLLKTLPPVNQWLNGKLDYTQIKQVRIEDLLGREPIKLNNRLVEDYFSGKVVLITGAAGSIGSEICRQLLYFKPAKIILLDQAESALYDLQTELNRKHKHYRSGLEIIIRNVVDQAKMEEVFHVHKPQVVFHAAAYKHVPLMEDDPYNAILVNVLGTVNLADLSKKYEVERFVYVSTDKAVNPTNVMGASKRLAEMYVQSLSAIQSKTRYITTRFGNVLGSNGSVIPLFRRQIEKGGPVTVTHPDIIRFFMTIPEACQLVLEAGTMGKGGEIYVFEMGEPVKILELAKRMIRLSGFEPEKDIFIEFTGLRPGEKLYEELIGDKEHTIPTHHPKILIAKIKPQAHDQLASAIKELQKVISYAEAATIVQQLKWLVPEYKSQNSVYSKLDHPILERKNTFSEDDLTN